MILADFSAVAYATIYAFSDDIKKGDAKEIENIFRHAFISTIVFYKKKFGKQYGDIVICCDGQKNYRFDIFENYKGRRKKNREEEKNKEDGLPWHILFNVMSKIRQESMEFWPWKVIHENRAEADDVMAVLTEDVANKNIIQVGVSMEEEPVLMICRDHDMFQLLKHQNVRQWDPLLKKFIKSEYPPKEFIRRHIVGGCGGDGVPNIFSDINIFMELDENGKQLKRQVAVNAKRLSPFLGDHNIFDTPMDDTVRKRLHENYQLVCFDGMPLDLRDAIIEKWHSAKKATKMEMYKYLARNRCNRLLDDIESM